VSEMSLNDAQTRVLGVIVDNDEWVTHETFKHLGLNKNYLTNVIHSLKKAGMLPRGFRVHRGHKIGPRLSEFIECVEKGLYVQYFAPRFDMKPSEARKLFKRLKASDHPRCRSLTLLEKPKPKPKPKVKPRPKPKPKVKPEPLNLCPICKKGLLHEGTCSECAFDEAEGIECPNGLIRPLEHPETCKLCSDYESPATCNWNQWILDEVEDLGPST